MARGNGRGYCRFAKTYGSKQSYLILSLLYPNRDWKDRKFEEDHIFPKVEFTPAKLTHRGYDDGKIAEYRKHYNCILNLELLEETENQEKLANPFDDWFASRDSNFKKRHCIPTVHSYCFDNFLEFISERRKLLGEKFKTFTI